jgi:hypothetical protein
MTEVNITRVKKAYSRVGNLSVILRDIKVNSNEDTFAFEIKVGDRELVG